MDKARLVWVELTKDEDGFAVEIKKEISAYVKEISVRRSEMYAAMQSGIHVETAFQMRQEEWEQTKHIVNGKKKYATAIIFEECEYQIIRTYKTGKANIELVCG